MSNERKRLSIVEYGTPVDLVATVSEMSKIDRTSANQILINAGWRIASYLKMKSNPIIVENKNVRAVDIAGIVRLSPSLELDIAPKFLGLADVNQQWREDFFFLSTLSRHGHLLTSENLSSSGGAVRDLSTLVARAFSNMYKAQRHRPLRAYRRTKRTDFSLDGEPDPVDLLFPTTDGFEQEMILFDRNNQWNSNIYAAARELLPEVSGSTAGNLLHLMEDLSPQSRFSRYSKKPIPSRHRGWQPLYDLSLDVLLGLGLTFKQGQAHAPGFVVSTWQIWEDLIAIGLGLGFGRQQILLQNKFKIGDREKQNPTKVTSVNVFPDCIVEGNQNHPKFILDAKYKGNIQSNMLRIAEADIYESLAFSRAANCSNVVLLYPSSATENKHTVGTCKVFEKIKIDDISIVGITIEVRGISKNGALKMFTNKLHEGLSNIFSYKEGTAQN